ncbi:MAG: hypothetical protein U1F53_17630 [Burkholderiaceae bacterium]
MPVPAKPVPASQPARGQPAPLQPLAEAYAEAAALYSRHAGVYTARIGDQPAVLWVGSGGAARRGDEAVLVPRLLLYRESLAGRPDVLAELRPVDDRRFDVLRACPPTFWNEQGMVVPPCEAPGNITWTRGLPSQWAEGQPLGMRLEAAGARVEVDWARVVAEAPAPDAGPPGEPPLEGQAWFEAVVAHQARPLGPPQRRGDNVWQPMRHTATGVEWDWPVALAQPGALASVQREVDRRVAIHVALALEAATQGRTAQALMRVRYASPRWLAMEASDAVVGTEQRRANERQIVWDLRSGKLVRFADGFRYATLKRLDGSIVLDLSREPAPGAEADRGLLGAALRALGPRRNARCMQRWLDAHACSTPGQCAWQPLIPADLVVFPTDEGLAVQFDHAAIETVATQYSRPLPDALRGPAWAGCVQDRVLLPWDVAMQARRADSLIELP